MTNICQIFRAFSCLGCSHHMALQCQLWSRSVLYSWSARCQANCEAGACQSGWESPRGFWIGHPWLFFLVLPASLYCARNCTQHMALYVYYWGHIVVSLSVLGLCELAAAADDMCHGFCMLCILDLAQCGRSRVPLPWCCWSALELPWSEPRCSFWWCFYWAIDMCGPCLQLLTHLCVRHHAEASHTRLQLYVALSRWLWSDCIRPSAGHFLLSCWHGTSNSSTFGIVITLNNECPRIV